MTTENTENLITSATVKITNTDINLTHKVVTSRRIARKLLDIGYTITDIKADRNNRDKTVFVFKVVDGFMDNLHKLAEANKALSEAKNIFENISSVSTSGGDIPDANENNG